MHDKTIQKLLVGELCAFLGSGSSVIIKSESTNSLNQWIYFNVHSASRLGNAFSFLGRSGELWVHLLTLPASLEPITLSYILSLSGYDRIMIFFSPNENVTQQSCQHLPFSRMLSSTCFVNWKRRKDKYCLQGTICLIKIYNTNFNEFY